MGREQYLVRVFVTLRVHVLLTLRHDREKLPLPLLLVLHSCVEPHVYDSWPW